MRTAFTILAALAAGQLVAPAAIADPVVTRHTTVHRVHGPLKILPHHNRKYCKMVWKDHRRVRKCWYH